MSVRKKLIIRAVIGGTSSILLLLGFWVWFHLTGITPQGVVPAGDFNLVSHATEAMIGSYWLATAAEFACAFALGAAVGISSMPFADDTHSLLKDSAFHFLITGALVFLNLWVQCLLALSRFTISAYILLYLLIWMGRWIGWYMEVAQIRAKLGLSPASSLGKWRETLPYLPFLCLLCVVLPAALMGVDRLLFRDATLLSGLFLPYLIYPVVGFCSGLSLGKRQGFCPLYPIAAWLLNLPVVLIFYNSSALFHCHTLFLFALAGNLTGTVYRRFKRRKEASS